MPSGYPINRTEALAKRSESCKRYAAAHMVDPIIRFWQKVSIQENGCWTWKGGISNSYPHFWLGGKTIKAYHFSLEYFRGIIIPTELQPDHLCRNKACVNPWHLEIVTPQENVRRALPNHQDLKTHCPRGHPYDEANTYRRPDRPQRNCKICKREAFQRWYQKTKESLGTTHQVEAG